MDEVTLDNQPDFLYPFTMTTKEIAELLTDETLVDRFSDDYGMSIFCAFGDDHSELRKSADILRAEILRRMKKT